MEATVRISLSETGQRDALAKGLPANREQTINVPVDNGDLQFFHVSGDGSLSLSLIAGASAVRDSWGSGWKNLSWDTYPTSEGILGFLRAREEARAVVVRAEEQARAVNAAEKQAEADRLYTEFVNRSPEQEKSASITRAKGPAVDAAQARVQARRDAETARANRVKSIPVAPIIHNITLLPSGAYEVVVPDGKYSEETRAKKVSAVNPVQWGGYAIEGAWAKCGETITVALGDVIAVGSKQWEGSRRRGGYVTSYALWVVTPTALLRHSSWDKVAVQATAEIMALSPNERIKGALKKRIESADKKVAALQALDRSAFEPEELGIIDCRLVAWQTVITDCERGALQGADPESNIRDLVTALAAIVAAGYRELAKRYN